MEKHNSVMGGVGDIHSMDKGTAARYNSGKSRTDLLPLFMVVESLNTEGFNRVQTDTYNALKCIAEFQRTGEENHIDEALKCLNMYWLDCADAFGYGAKKYASWNWVKGMNWSVPIGCIGRHAFAIFDGQLNDSESTLPHVGHVMCNVVMLKAYYTSFPEGNDLPPKYFAIK